MTIPIDSADTSPDGINFFDLRNRWVIIRPNKPEPAKVTQ